MNNSLLILGNPTAFSRRKKKQREESFQSCLVPFFPRLLAIPAWVSGDGNHRVRAQVAVWQFQPWRTSLQGKGQVK